MVIRGALRTILHCALDLDQSGYLNYLEVRTMIRTFLKRVAMSLSVEVPADVAACEFDCREIDCPNEKFEACPRRLQKEEALKSL